MILNLKIGNQYFSVCVSKGYWKQIGRKVHTPMLAPISKILIWLKCSAHCMSQLILGTPYITNQQYVFGHNHFVHQLLKKTAMWTCCNLKNHYAIVVQEKTVHNPRMHFDVIINLVSRWCLLLHCLNFFQRNTFKPWHWKIIYNWNAADTTCAFNIYQTNQDLLLELMELKTLASIDCFPSNLAMKPSLWLCVQSARMHMAKGFQPINLTSMSKEPHLSLGSGTKLQ